jgi:hypothetical protein
MVKPAMPAATNERWRVFGSKVVPVVGVMCCFWLLCLLAGAVECWLLEVQGAMKRTTHSITREALTAYPKAARTSWILQWPGQLVLNGSQVWPTAAQRLVLVIRQQYQYDNWYSAAHCLGV